MDAKVEQQARECAQHPELLAAHIDDSSFDQLVFVGDLHGDLGLWRVIACHVAKVAKPVSPTGDVMDRHADLEWTGGRTCFVLLGDILDGRKHPLTTIPGEQVYDEAQILWEINQLSLQALLVGGRVVKCMGNHERMNQRGLFLGATSVSQKDPRRTQSSAFLGQGMYSTLLQSCGIFAAVKIGPFLALHGGVAPELIKEILQLPHSVHHNDLLKLAKQVMEIIFHPQITPPGQHSDMEKLVNILLDSPNSLLWSRHFSAGNPPPCESLTQVLADVNRYLLPRGSKPIEAMIVGHTIQSFRTHPSGLWHQESEKNFYSDRAIHTDIVESGTDPKGIRLACPGDSVGFRLYMIDVGQSRGIDMPSDRTKLSDARLPSVLRFVRAGPMGQWAPQTVVARHHLPRLP